MEALSQNIKQSAKVIFQIIVHMLKFMVQSLVFLSYSAG